MTLTSVTDNPTDNNPTVGEPTPQVVGGSPKGEKNPKGNDLPPTSVQQAEASKGQGQQEEGESPQKNEPKTPGTADAVTGRAVACLGRLGRVEPSLKLSMRESLRLAPLAAQWLAEGLAEVDVIKALTRALPPSVDSAAALVSYRLKNHQPEKAAPLTLVPSPAPVKREQCPECHRPYRPGHPGGLCRDCRNDG